MAMSGIPIKKVYIYSRCKTNDSKSDSELKYELVQSIQLPDKCAMFLDGIITPVSWFNVDEDKQIYLYTKI